MKQSVFLRDVIAVLRKEDITSDEIEQAIEDLIDIDAQSIRWTVEDFEMEARNMADDQWDTIYDPELFESALETMIRKADAEIGVIWETVRVYLDDRCKRKEI